MLFLFSTEQRRLQTSAPPCVMCLGQRERMWSWSACSASPTSKCAGWRTASPWHPQTASRSSATATATCCESWRQFQKMRASTPSCCPTIRSPLRCSPFMVRSWAWEGDVVCCEQRKLEEFTLGGHTLVFITVQIFFSFDCCLMYIIEHWMAFILILWWW